MQTPDHLLDKVRATHERYTAAIEDFLSATLAYQRAKKAHEDRVEEIFLKNDPKDLGPNERHRAAYVASITQDLAIPHQEALERHQVCKAALEKAQADWTLAQLTVALVCQGATYLPNPYRINGEEGLL